MKKKYLSKKILVIVILLLILICLPIFQPIEVRGYFVPYEYTIHGTYIEINKYTGIDAEVEIPSYMWLRPVKEISDKNLKGAFEELDYVTYVKMPNTVTTLSRISFWNCCNLEEIVMSKNIKKIPVGCFTNCDKLTNVVLHEKVEEVEREAFAACDLLKRVTFHNSETRIAENAFQNRTQSCNFDILTLVSAKDSAVEKYAKEHGIKWEELEE
ncbi:MAG: leucine-rich repeat domain-containing protein [Lachnospiraceae bacterium]|nr:leucine-rich repeat domain-containing protein [Lachnospiraceae bacterium]